MPIFITVKKKNGNVHWTRLILCMMLQLVMKIFLIVMENLHVQTFLIQFTMYVI